MAAEPEDGPRSCLQLGMGWFPDQPGGLNRYFRDLSEALARSGLDVRAVVRGPVNEAPNEVAVEVIPPGARAQVLRRFAVAASVDGPHEIVDSHFALYSLLPTVAGKRRGAPLVVHFHGPWAAEGEVDGQHFLKTHLKGLVERIQYRHARETIVLSRAFGRVLIERYGVLPWHVNVVPPGVDLERFSPGDQATARRELRLPENAWILLTARRLVPRMGLDVLIDAWREIAANDRLLLIVGDGHVRQELEERVARYGLQESVRFLGQVSEMELAACYRAADLSVVPSRSLEGFGLVALEALACGTPVVVTEVGGLPEAVAGLARDLVVPAGDVALLAARLRAAADGSQPLPSPSACRKHAEQFTWPRAVERHLDVYRRAIRRGRRRRLRVVYLDHTAKLSGGELALLRLLPQLDEVDAHVILGEDGPLVARLAAAGISSEVLPLAKATRERSRLEVGRFAATSNDLVHVGPYVARLAWHLRRLGPDLVHTNSLKSALYGGVAGRLAGVPVLWHVRDRIADDYLTPGGARLVRKVATVLPAAIIANSNATLATLPATARGWVVPSPVEIPAVRPQRRRTSLRVGILGRIAPWKGQDVFLRAFGQAFPNGSETAYVIGAPMFGAAEEAYAGNLKTLAFDLGLGDRVSFTGFVDDVTRALADVDVLVHASVLPEPFGQVIAEGMAAGIPVVAAAAGGPAEMIEDGIDGLLYPPGDVGALASALRKLVNDPALCQRISAAASQRAQEFSPARVAERVMDVYASILPA